MQSGFLLDVVVRQGAAILELLPGEDQNLVVGWNSFLVLNLRFDVLNGIARFNIERDGLPSEGLHKDLHICVSGD